MVDHKTEELCKLGKQIVQLANQATKGQLILECPFDVSNFPKNQRKI